MGIIEELDKEGINLQETILNLKNQDYDEIYNDWLHKIWVLTINLRVSTLCYNQSGRLFNETN